ncbi:hypothetical protein LLG39_11415 [bacterium]|nr:hypothetical protein [bacterium]
MPSGGKYFGCRQCYNLTYTSCNDSHRFDGLFRLMGAKMGMSAKDVKRTLDGR